MDTATPPPPPCKNRTHNTCVRRIPNNVCIHPPPSSHTPHLCMLTPNQAIHMSLWTLSPPPCKNLYTQHLRKTHYKLYMYTPPLPRTALTHVSPNTNRPIFLIENKHTSTHNKSYTLMLKNINTPTCSNHIYVYSVYNICTYLTLINLLTTYKLAFAYVKI